MMGIVLQGTYNNGVAEGSHSFGTSRQDYQDMIDYVNQAAQSGQIGRISGISAAQLEQGAGGYAHLTPEARKLLGSFF